MKHNYEISFPKKIDGLEKGLFVRLTSIEINHLFLGSLLGGFGLLGGLGSLLGSRLLGRGLLGCFGLGSLGFGSSLLGGLCLLGLGSLLRGLGLLGLGSLLGGLSLLGLLSGLLLDNLLLGLLFFNLGGLERSGSSLTLDLDEGLLFNKGLDSLLDEWGQLDGVNLVVGSNVFLDGSQGGAFTVLQSLDSSHNHDCGLGVGRGSLGFGGLLSLGSLGGGCSSGSSVGHDEVQLVTEKPALDTSPFI